MVKIEPTSRSEIRNADRFHGSRSHRDGPETSSRKKDKGSVMMVNWSGMHGEILKRGRESCSWRNQIWLRTSIAKSSELKSRAGTKENARIRTHPLFLCLEEKGFGKGSPTAIMPERRIERHAYLQGIFERETEKTLKSFEF